MAYTSTDYRPNQPEANARIYIDLIHSQGRELGVHDRWHILEISDSGGMAFTRHDIADQIRDSDERGVLKPIDAYAAARVVFQLTPPVPYGDA